MKKRYSIIPWFKTLLLAALMAPMFSAAQDTIDLLNLNMDAGINRPGLKIGSLPLSIGGYAEVKGEYIGTDGTSDGLNFNMQRVALFLSSNLSKRVSFLTEVEMVNGTQQINLNTAVVNIQFNKLLNLRGGVILIPIGAFNENHDGPRTEFVDRPLYATQLLPATLSSPGFGLFGKTTNVSWAFAYEAYITNGFDGAIINNSVNRTFLPAANQNGILPVNSTNGQPLISGKVAVKNKAAGELGLSYMDDIYNHYQEDGLVLDVKRRMDVVAIDYNTTIAKSKTKITAEFAEIMVQIPPTYTEQYGKQQQGGYIDVVQPIVSGKLLGFDKSSFNAGVRFEYIDYNVGKFTETGGNIYDDLWTIVPGVSFHAGENTVLKLNYRYQSQRDILGNNPSKTGGIQFGIASYF